VRRREGATIYICLECGHVFDEPEIVLEIHDELPEHPVERFCACPDCGDGGFEEAQYCSLCRKPISKSQARFCLCPECEEAAEKRFKKILRELFTKNELEYLNNQYDGENFEP
jgi:DNA-directed RNA polymerase subunit RPC12/RpoP